jgi:Leucine-rich repeat (LRR) protein
MNKGYFTDNLSIEAIAEITDEILRFEKNTENRNIKSYLLKIIPAAAAFLLVIGLLNYTGIFNIYNMLFAGTDSDIETTSENSMTDYPPQAALEGYAAELVPESPYSAMRFTGMDINPIHDGGDYYTYQVYDDPEFVAKIWEAIRFSEWTERDTSGGGMIVIEFTFYGDEGELTLHFDPNDVVAVIDTENPFIFHDDGSATKTPPEYFNVPAGTYMKLRKMLLGYTTENFNDYIVINGQRISTKATHLDLDSSQLTNADIEPLKYMVNLESLSIYGPARNTPHCSPEPDNISDLSPIAGLTNLKWLTVRGNQINDISLLAGLTNLRTLYLEGNQISDISALSSLTKLFHLNLRDNQISDITPLAGLTDLIRLNLEGNQIADISPLAGLTKLIELNLRENQITGDVSGTLAGFTELYMAWLDGNRISSVSGDIHTLAGLTELNVLNLARNQITDISGLAGLPNLDSVWLVSNQISDVTPLAGLTSLTMLSLFDNQIRDISGLAGLTNLKELFLHDNPLLTSEQVEELRTALPNTIIENEW